MKQLNGLTGIRGYAALWVVFYHFLIVYDPVLNYSLGIGSWLPGEFIRSIAMHGQLAVDIFFILSGFILSYIYADFLTENPSPRRYALFLLKRLIRIYPVYVLGLLSLILLHACGLWQTQLALPQALPYHFTLTYNTLLGYPIEYGETWNLPGWSLTAEWTLYLLFPFLLLLLYCLRLPALLDAPLLVLLCLGGAWAVPYTQTIPIPQISVIGPTALVRAFFGFLIGHAVYRLYRRSVSSWDSVGLCMLLIMLAVLCYDYLFTRWGINSGLLILYSCVSLLIFAIAAEDRLMNGIFANPVAVWLGDISYPVYIFHYPLLAFCSYYQTDLQSWLLIKQNDPALLWLFFGELLAGILLLSTLIHRLYEKPLNRVLRRKAAQWLG